MLSARDRKRVVVVGAGDYLKGSTGAQVHKRAWVMSRSSLGGYRGSSVMSACFNRALDGLLWRNLGGRSVRAE
jgi:hypothetical protein